MNTLDIWHPQTNKERAESLKRAEENRRLKEVQKLNGKKK